MAGGMNYFDIDTYLDLMQGKGLPCKVNSRFLEHRSRLLSYKDHTKEPKGLITRLIGYANIFLNQACVAASSLLRKQSSSFTRKGF
jgi:hypothetical protein